MYKTHTQKKKKSLLKDQIVYVGLNLNIKAKNYSGSVLTGSCLCRYMCILFLQSYLSLPQQQIKDLT